jgi:hypothetical protein
MLVHWQAPMQPTTHQHANGDAALAAFLGAHLGRVEANDVGPLLGQAAWIVERGGRTVAVTDELQRVQNAALAGADPRFFAGH